MKPSRRPSVAIIGTRGYPSYYGGFETAVRHLAPFLVDSGWQVSVYSRPEATLADDEGRDHRVSTITTRGVNSRCFSTLTYGATASIDAVRRRPDVALVMNVANGFWLPLLRARGIRTLVNVDGMEWKRTKWGTLARSVFLGGARATARWADALVVDAVEIGRHWREDFGREGTFIPYGGQEYDDAVPPEFERRSYVLFVARLVPENSVWEFLDAARRLAGSRDVVIVGSSGFGGPVETAVRDLARAHPRIHWLGQVSDDRRLHALWHHAGAYFHGHSVGGTNPALVQAMMCGAPVVARDTPYNREVLGDSGVLVRADAAEITGTLAAVLGDRERQESLSTAALDRARAEYSWKRVLDDYERALRDLLPR
ncbi:glycosyltransferase [Antribacter gilvus]|uniref:glycosyltransferase n=1 Tax=Antribacter gilvus TaxID=2304675 RepID=UPI001F0BCDDC|nr:glycosyltransferase [Antribacter gilvus]